ncbi:MAG: SusC/RagA family TonB-linked outer membrane protein [Cyclobacteriaceae bacterium]|jgi:TonB-linked SusC/RagA family outer membrane protein|nr:SusC/RagA family TonB-linked outer membrane protein [Flammeovirgaceae bacterium]
MTKLYLFVRRYLAVMMMFGAASAFAQQSVSGKVTSSDDGSAIPGVNILEKGTSNGTVTDADGNFTISVGANATLVFSFVGYTPQEAAVGAQTTLNVTLQSDVTALSEVVVVGYGTQDKKEITSSVATLSTKDFNVGNINDPTQLLQGKVAGLSIYNRGGDPNSSAVIRLRGISTVGSNVQPLVVIDGVLGASLDNVDPNDIESINVLKDGSAAAIYGSRGSSGVILVTTKRGSGKGGLSIDYNGYVAAAEVANRIPVMTASQYVAAGGNNLGSVTDWQKEVTRTGVSNVHNISIAGGSQQTQFRISSNFRNVNGVLKKSGFDQINTRASLTHTALNDKLRMDVNMSFTNRNSNFSFNEALRYAVLFNPTAPIRFNTGDYYQAILFDNFNPVAILEQNVNEGKRKNLNYNAKVDYTVIDNLTVTVNYGQQFESVLNGEYYSRNSLFRGLNRGGLARRYTSDRSFTLFEGYATYSKKFDKIDLSATAGYSYQEDQFEDIFLSLGNFPNDQLGYNALENSGDILSGNPNLLGISSSKTPINRIIATFARVNLTYDNAIFFNASVRREGSTKLGANNRYGVFPAAGLGVDLNKYLQIDRVDNLKIRIGYGVTGSLPTDSGVAQDLYTYSNQGGGSITRQRAGNPNLRWEEKVETNLGIDFGLWGKLSGSLDVYTRSVKDFVSLVPTQIAQVGAPFQFQNAGSLKTDGIELNLTYASLQFGQVRWTPGIVLSSYKSTLESIVGASTQVRANLGAPGQNSTPQIRVAVGEEIGQIWGPVFAGVNTDGTPKFADLNGDGTVKAAPGDALLAGADFKKLGNGIPTMEIGWRNQLNYKNWDMNVFFRAAFGHSLVNNFRAFYEPIDLGAINSYNRVITNKAVAGLTSAQYSSLYVESADFFRLDNMQIGYTVKGNPNSTFKNIRFYISGQNLFTITSYSGIDPEPVLQDPGAVDNGGFASTTSDVLAPGIDRRNNYFTARTYTFGLSVGL